MKKIIGTGIVSLILVGCGNQGNQSTVDKGAPAESEEQSSGTATITFNIDDQLYSIDEDELNQEVEWTEEVTVLEVMQNQFDAVDNEGFITSIEGYEQLESKQAYWLFDINGESSTVGAGDYVLEDGDEILWNLETNQSDE
ncbi:DUF4430 domain-containing protein [Marinilactibacillus kalidii]|uniref:DUF4430 domain-containing protein n=1 Tax=Marinilactibacillus kalidii TaxID=2820274 RepID=UPI001ABDB92E|nr:DUF4430 domain-containing protein [Marinilactibacillus kalidii]